MALFLSGELIPVLGFVCKREADRIFVARGYFEALGQNTFVYFSPSVQLSLLRRVRRRNLWYLKHLRIDL